MEKNSEAKLKHDVTKCRKVLLMYSPLVPEGPQDPYSLRYTCRRWEAMDTWIRLSETQQERKQE